MTSRKPTGGRYDGILGVHAGIEALKTMNDYEIETEYPTGNESCIFLNILLV